jgi:hypothetical protein
MNALVEFIGSFKAENEKSTTATKKILQDSILLTGRKITTYCFMQMIYR